MGYIKDLRKKVGHNPYIFKVNECVVKTEFTKGGPTIEKGITDVFKSIYK